MGDGRDFALGFIHREGWVYRFANVRAVEDRGHVRLPKGEAVQSGAICVWAAHGIGTSVVNLGTE